MSFFNAILRRAAFVLALTGLAGAATAGPMYHVAINTGPLSAWGNGVLELAMSQFGGAPGSTATVSHLSAGFDDRSGPFQLSGDSGFDAVDRTVTFGGTLGFDVEFGGAFLTTAGDPISFTVSLFDSDWTTYLGADMALATFTLADQGVVVDVAGQGTTVGPVAAVPEASQWAIFLTGLVLLGATLRRRTQQ